MTDNNETVSGSQGNAGPEESKDILTATIDNVLNGWEDDDAPAAKSTAENEDTTPESIGKTDIPEEGKDPKADDEEPATADILNAPEHWKAEYKDVYNALSPEAKKAWLAHAKDYEKGFSQQGEKFAEQRKNWEAVDQALAGFDTGLKQMNLTKPQFVNFLVQNFAAYSRDPVAFAKILIDQHKLTADQLFQTSPTDQNQKWEDPQVKTLHEKVSQIEAYHSRLRQEAEASRRAAEAANFLNSVSSLTDDSGTPLYPHFDDELAVQMNEVIQTSPAIANLQDPRQKFDMAYKIAVGQNQHKIVEKELAKKMQEVEAAKVKAAKTIKPSIGSNGQAVKGKQSLDDILSSTLGSFGLE